MLITFFQIEFKAVRSVIYLYVYIVRFSFLFIFKRSITKKVNLDMSRLKIAFHIFEVYTIFGASTFLKLFLF